MMSINHPDEYYQQALTSQGIDYRQLSHPEVATFMATCKAIEADLMIEIAEELPATTIESVDIEKVCPAFSKVPGATLAGANRIQRNKPEELDEDYLNW
jgi:hypothetical protein